MEYDERECIKAELDDIANLDTLKNYVDVVLVDRVKKTAEKLCSFTQGCFSGINGGFGEEINVFQEHFKKEFEKLDVLQIDDNLIREEMNKSTSVDSAQLGNVENYVNDLVFKENMKKFGGAAAGAAIGSMIAPGIGTVIGGVIGLMSGGGNVEKAKLQVKEQVDNIFRTDIMKIIANAVGMFKNIIGKKENSIETEINKYMECYRSYVIETENEFIKRKTIVQKKIDDVNKDLSEISMRKFRLDSVAQNIKQLD